MMYIITAETFIAVPVGSNPMSNPKSFRVFSNQSKHRTSISEHTRDEALPIITRAQNGSEGTNREKLSATDFWPLLMFCLGSHIGCYISHTGICKLLVIICGYLITVIIVPHLSVLYSNEKKKPESFGTARVAIFVCPRDKRSKFSKIKHYSWSQPMQISQNFLSQIYLVLNTFCHLPTALQS